MSDEQITEASGDEGDVEAHKKILRGDEQGSETEAPGEDEPDVEWHKLAGHGKVAGF